MRRWFMLAFVANLVLAFGSLAILPARVAVHFGPGGVANGWGPAYVHAVLFAAINTLMFLAIRFTPELTFVMPARWVNLPNKQYWLQEANRPRTREILAAWMWQYGTVLFLFLLAVQALCVAANLSDPVRLHEPAFLIALGLFLAYTVYWCVGFYRAFRLPPDAAGAPRP